MGGVYVCEYIHSEKRRKLKDMPRKMGKQENKSFKECVWINVKKYRLLLWEFSFPNGNISQFTYDFAFDVYIMFFN